MEISKPLIRRLGLFMSDMSGGRMYICNLYHVTWWDMDKKTHKERVMEGVPLVTFKGDPSADAFAILYRHFESKCKPPTQDDIDRLTKLSP